MKSSTLLTFPVELLGHILEYLDVCDLLRCGLVNKSLRNVILESSRLQYTIELAMHYMVSTLPASALPPFAKRLELLRERESAWTSLAWKSQHKLKLPHSGSVYEFVGGFYGNGKEDARKVTASIAFFELPFAQNVLGAEPNMKMWTHSMDDHLIIDFTMDPLQDLLVLVALTAPESKFVYELHLRTLSTNEPHPKAPFPILPCLTKPEGDNPYPTDGTAVRVQVTGDLVVLLVKEARDNIGAHLEIWNWEHGPQYSCSMSRITGIDDICFLSHDTFLLVRPTGKFEVCTFENPITASSTPISRICYAFPQLATGYRYWYISISSNPAPGYFRSECQGPDSPLLDCNGHWTAEQRKRQIYHPSPNERILACCVYIFDPHSQGDRHVHSFVFFVNVSVFLKSDAWCPLPTTARKSSLSPSPSGIPNVQSPLRLPSPVAGPSMNRDLLSTPELNEVDPPWLFEFSPPSSPISLPSSPLLLPLSQSPHALAHPLSHSAALFNLATSFAPISPAGFTASFSPFSRPMISPDDISSDLFSIPTHIPQMVPWEKWGPPNTRWFEECINTDWQHAVYGLRAIDNVSAHVDVGSGLPADGGLQWNLEGAIQGTGPDDVIADGLGTEDGEDRGGQSKQYVRIRDFNPHFIQRCLNVDEFNATTGDNNKGKNAASWRTRRVVVEPRITPVHGVFVHDIVSSLPYVEIVSEEAFDVTDVMMDDSRVLLLMRGQTGQLEGIDVLTI